MTRSSNARVLPVGLAIGQVGSSPAARYAVADTAGVQRLSADEWQVWTLAAGVGSTDGASDHEALSAVAGELGMAEFSSVYYGLLERRLLIETDFSGDWAGTVTLQPLLSGLGELDREGTQFGLGVIGEAPIVRLDAASYDAWQWLPFGPSLATAAQTLGLAGGVHGWTTVTDRIAALIARGAAYLQVKEERQ